MEQADAIRRTVLEAESMPPSGGVTEDERVLLDMARLRRIALVVQLMVPPSVPLPNFDSSHNIDDVTSRDHQGFIKLAGKQVGFD